MTAGHPYEGLLGEFLMEARERISQAEESMLQLGVTTGAVAEGLLEQIRRALHTLKGNAGMMGFHELQQSTHELEEQLKGASSDEVDVAVLLASLDGIRQILQAAVGELVPDESPDVSVGELEATSGTNAAVESVRVPFAALDHLIELVAEMVISRNRLANALDWKSIEGDGKNLRDQIKVRTGEIQMAYEGLARTLDEIQDRILELRMVPLRTLFVPLNRLVYDEGGAAGKKVRLETTGGDTPLDKALLELANEVLGHLVRNAVIHGLETPAKRQRAKKSPHGTIRVDASSSGEAVHIRVSDDGSGIDQEALLRAAKARGIDVSALEDPFSLLFVDGLTTRDGADLSAGRGVGLAAVQEAVRRQGGRIAVSSEPGQGTEFRLSLPLSVSITRALLIRVDQQDYALPITAVVESQRFHRGPGHAINGARVWKWGNEIIPLLDLGCSFATAATVREEGYVIVIRQGDKYRGLVADRIQGIQEIVVKGLDPIAGRPSGVAGSTILGDGRPILILDPRGLVELEPFVEAVA